MTIQYTKFVFENILISLNPNQEILILGFLVKK